MAACDYPPALMRAIAVLALSEQGAYMKIPPSFLSRRFCCVLLGVALGMAGGVHGATLTVTPSAISNTYSGAITLTIGGLTNGETVVMEKYFDLNTNSVIDAGDFLTQSFRLTDGLLSTIGGKTNLNVPGDSTATNGAITTQLNFYRFGAEHLVGKYAFRLSSPTARFTPVTNLFTITNFNYAQSFTGFVKSGTTNIANAVVVLFDSVSHNLAGSTVANNAGSYTVKAAPGTYQLVAFKSNYITDAAAPFLTLTNGATFSTNVNVIPATRNISGKIVDAANLSVGLPAFFFTVRNNSRAQAFCSMDNNGNFNVPVTADQWNVRPQSSLALLGYVELNNGISVDTSTGSVAGVIVPLPKATAMFYGSIKDNLNNPLPGVTFYGNDDTNYYSADATSDGSGNYAAGVTPGIWQVQIDNQNPSLVNYVFTQGLGRTNINNGQALLQNFVAKLATNTVSGFVKNNSNLPVVGVDVDGYDETGFSSQQSRTDNNGFYSFKVANGNWHVNVNCGCSGCSHSLASLGYQCVNEQIVIITNNNATTNFTVYPCGALQVTTSSPLPGGIVNSFYSFQLQASGCSQPFNWSLSPGSAALPSGLNLYSDGTISGFPDTPGTYNFSARVTDNSFTTADQPLSLTINSSGALQVTTTSLPGGTRNVAYSQTVNATGGQPPYTWSLAPGSAPLPTGCAISTNGTISGTPTAGGQFDFFVRVTDSLAATADQFLSITIVNPPLQITTLSLSNAQQGAFYSTQLQASGGQTPYSWSLAPGSLSLPPVLSLSSSGVLSGTPATNGTFNFIVRVTDFNSIFTNRSLALTINPRPTLTALNLSGNQFQLQLAGATGQNYTVQFSTNLGNSNWSSLLVTNPAASPVTILDANATNSRRFYRALLGP